MNDQWLTDFEHRLGARPTFDGKVLCVDASNVTQLSLDTPSSVESVAVSCAGTASRVFRVSAPATHLRSIDFLRCSAAEVVLEGDIRLASCTVTGLRPGLPILLVPDVEAEIASLHVANCVLHLEAYLPGLARLGLRDGGLITNDEYSVERLLVEGQVHISARDFRADVLQLDQPKAVIDLGRGTLTCGRVDPDGGTTLSLHGRGGHRFQFRSLPKGMALLIQDAVVEFPKSDAIASELAALGDTRDTPFDGLRLSGHGHLVVEGVLTRPTFMPDSSLEVHLAGGALVAANGSIALEEATGGLCQGSREHNSLTIQRIGSVDQTDFEYVNLYSLDSLESLGKLEKAGRIIPWIPRALRARRLQRGQWRDPSLNADVRWTRIAAFWRKLQQLLTDRHAGGTVQSDVRVAFLRARRRAASWRRDFRERMLLTLYALVGYGERITTPLLLWVVWCIAAAGTERLFDVVPTSERPWRTFAFLVAAPLTWFRIAISRPNFPGVWDTVFVIMSQVLGAVLLGFALLAARRLLRPEGKA